MKILKSSTVTSKLDSKYSTYLNWTYVPNIRWSNEEIVNLTFIYIFHIIILEVDYHDSLDTTTQYALRENLTLMGFTLQAFHLSAKH